MFERFESLDEVRMDPNENPNARFSIVRAWQGYTVIGVLCIQTIPVLFSFFSFPSSFFLGWKRLVFRNYASFTIEKTKRWEIIIMWETIHRSLKTLRRLDVC